MRTIYVSVALSLALSGQVLAQLKCTYCTVTPKGGTARSSTNELALVEILPAPTSPPGADINDTPRDIFIGSIVLTGHSEFSITGIGHYTIYGVISSASAAPPATLSTSLTLSVSVPGSWGGSWGGQNAGITFAGTEANTYRGETKIKNGYIACNKSDKVVAIPGNIIFKPGTATDPHAGLWFGANGQLGGGGVLKFERDAGAGADAIVNLNGTTQSLLGIEGTTDKDIIGNVNPASNNVIPPSLNRKNITDKAILILTGTGATRYTFGDNAQLRGWLEAATDNGGLEIQVNGTSQLFSKPAKIKNLTFNTGESGTLEVTAGTDVLAFGDGITFKGTGTIKKTETGIITMKNSTLSQSGGTIWVSRGTLKNDGTLYPTGDSENKAILQVESEVAEGLAVFDMNGRNSIFGGLKGSGTVYNNLGPTGGSHNTLTLNLNDNQTQTFDGIIKDNSGDNTVAAGVSTGGIALKKEGNGTQILNGTNTFTGSVNITGGFLGGTGDLRTTSGVTVAAGGSIGGGLGTADNGGTLKVSRLTFAASTSKLIVTKRSTDNTPSLVEVKTSGTTTAWGRITGNFTVDIVGSTLESGYILKGIPASVKLVPTLGTNNTGKSLSFEWDGTGLYMSVLTPGLVCNNCSFTKNGETVTGSTYSPVVIISGTQTDKTFAGNIALTDNCKFTIVGTGNYTLSGQITGNYSLTLSAPGAGENGLGAGFTLSGDASNEHGRTYLENGYLICNKDAGKVAIPNNISIFLEDGKDGKKASLWCMANNQFGRETVIDFTNAKATSSFYLNGTTQTVAGLKANNQYAEIVNGTGTTNRPLPIGTARIGAAILNVAVPSGTGTFGGGGSIYKGEGEGTGGLTVNITSGTQIIENPGGNIHDVTLTSGAGATLEFNTTTDNAYSMGGTGDGNVILKGAGIIKKTGAGTVSMGKNSTLLKSAGEILVSAGTLRNGEQSSYTRNESNNKAILKIEASTGFDIRGNNSLFGGLTGGGTVYNSFGPTGGGHNTLTLNQNDTANPSTFSGVIKDNNSTTDAAVGEGEGKGGIALKKEGNGTQILTGANLYTGSTTISAGTLKLEGEGAKLNNGTYAGNLEIANVSSGTPAVFEYNGSTAQTFDGVIKSSGAGSVTGDNLGTFRQSGTGKSIINGTTNTFTGKVDITHGFLGGTGNLSTAKGVAVEADGSIGGGPGTEGAGGTLIVSDLTFAAAASKLIVTKRSADNTPSLVEVKTSGGTTAGTITAANNFTVDIVGATIESGYILKGTPAAGSQPLPTAGTNNTGKSLSFKWDDTGLLMTVRESGLVCDNCSFTKDGQPFTGSTERPAVIISGTQTGEKTFAGDITLNGNCKFTIGGKGNYTLSGKIKMAETNANSNYSLTYSAPSAVENGLDAGFTLSGSESNDYGTTILENGYIICNKGVGKAAIPKNIQILSKDGKKAGLWCMADNQFGSKTVETVETAETVIDFTDAGAASSFYLNGTSQTVAGLKANNSFAQVINNLAADFHPFGMTNAQVKTDVAATLTIAALAGADKTCTFGGGGSIYKGGTPALTVNIKSGTQIIENPGEKIHDVTLSADATATLEFKTTGNGPYSMGGTGDGNGNVILKGAGTIKKTGTAIITMNGSTISQSSGGIIQVNGGILQNKNTIYPTGNSDKNKAFLDVDEGTVFDIYGINSLFGGLGGDGTVYNNLGPSTGGGYNTLTLSLDSDQTQTFAGVIKNNDTAGGVVTATGTGKGGINLKKEGNGTQILTGANLYTGSTTVSAGTLKLGGDGKLKNGTYTGALEIANVSAEGATPPAPAIFEHNGNETQTFTGEIKSSGTGANLGTFRQSGTGKSIINGTTNTFTGKVEITHGFLGGTGNLSTAGGVTVESDGSIGGGPGTAGNGGTLIVSNLTFTAAASKLIVTKRSGTDNTPSLVEVKTTGTTTPGPITAANNFTVDIVGTTIESGCILKCSSSIPAGSRRPLPVVGLNNTGKYPAFEWKADGLYMTLRESGLVCDNCRFTKGGQELQGSPESPAVIIDGMAGGTFDGEITLNGNCTFTIGGTGNYILSGKITGGYSLTYIAPGAGNSGLGAGFTLSGRDSNDYGSTTLENGYLICNKTNATAIPKNIQILSKNGKKAGLWCMADNQFGSETVIDFTGAEYEAAIWLNGTTQQAAGLKSNNGYAHVNNTDRLEKANTPNAVTRGTGAATLNIAVPSGKTYTFTGGENMNKWGVGDSQVLTVNVTSGTQIIENPKTRQLGGAVVFTSDAGATLELRNNTTTGTDAGFGGITGSPTTIQGDGILKKTGVGTISINSTLLISAAGEVLVSDGILKNGAAAYEKRGTESNNALSNKAILNIGTPAANTENNYPAFDIRNTHSIFGGLTGGGYVYNSDPNAAYTSLTLNPSGTSTFSGVIKDNLTNTAVTGTGTVGGVALEKEGNGTQVLKGANLYTGSTKVSAGTLKLGDGGKLQNGAYTGELEIANVSAGAPAVFEHNGTATQTFTGVIKSSGTGTGANLGTFLQSGDGKSIINGDNTFTGNVNITKGFLGGTGNLSKANGVTVAADGSIGGGLGTEGAGGTLIVSNLTFAAAASKLIVTKRPATDNTPSLVDVKTSEGTAGSITAANNFTVEIVGTTIQSGYIIKCTEGTGLPIPYLALPTNSTLRGKVRLTWDSNGLWMQVREGTITLSNASSICPKGAINFDNNPSIIFTATYSSSSDLPPAGVAVKLANYSFTLSSDNVKKGIIKVEKKDQVVTATFNGANSTDADLTYTITYDDHRNPPVTSSEQKINRRPTLTVKSGARVTEVTEGSTIRTLYTLCFGTRLELQAAGNGVPDETPIVEGKGLITSLHEDIATVVNTERPALTTWVNIRKVGEARFLFTDRDGCKSDYLDVSVKELPVITTEHSTICAIGDDNMSASTTLTANHDPDTTMTTPWVINPADGFWLDDDDADPKKASLSVMDLGITKQKHVTVEYTDNFGCKGTTVITVNPNPVVLSSTPLNICASVKGVDAAPVLTADHEPAATSAWAIINPAVPGVSVDDGTAGDKAATFKVTSADIKKQVQAVVQYTDNLGCKGRTTITVNPVPVMTVLPDKSTICSGDKTSISLSVSNLDDPESKLTYSWKVSDNNLGATNSDNQTTFKQQTLTVKQGDAESSVIYTFTPKYTSTLATATAADYCEGRTGKSEYTVSPRGTASISNSQTMPEEVCFDDKITLKAEPTTGTLTYQWLKNGKSIENAVADSFTVPTDKAENASYAVSITNSYKCVATSDSKRVNVSQDAYFTYAKPTAANATMDNTVVEINRPVNFKYEGPVDAVYSWDFGDKTDVVTTQNASHTYSEMGTYKPVLLVVKQNQVNCKKTLALPDLKVTAITGDLNGSTAISAYPVPAQDRLTIVNESGDLQNITVHDLSGKQVVNEAVSGSKATVSVAHLANGIYLLTITCSKGVKHMKISKN